MVVCRLPRTLDESSSRTLSSLLKSLRDPNAARLSIFETDNNATCSISGLTIRGGDPTVDGDGIGNPGELTRYQIVLYANFAEDIGCTVYNRGELTTGAPPQG
jgi:hypothetical protein